MFKVNRSSRDSCSCPMVLAVFERTRRGSVADVHNASPWMFWHGDVRALSHVKRLLASAGSRAQRVGR